MSTQKRDSGLWSGGRWRVLMIVAAGWFLSLGVRLLFPVILPYMREDLEFGLSTSGLLLTFLWGAYAVGQLPGGVLTDRVGERKVFIVSTFASAMTVGLITVSKTVWTLFLGTVLFGFATALYGPGRFTLLSDIYPNHDGSAIGFTQAAGSVGNSLIPFASGLIAAYFSWRAGVGFVAPLFLGCTVGLWYIVPERSGETGSPVDKLSLRSVRYVLTQVMDREILQTTGILVLIFFIIQGFTGFYPTYLISVKELSPQFATGLFGLYYVIAIGLQLLAGNCYDRYGPRSSLFVLVSVVVAMLAALPFVSSIPGLVVITMLLSCLEATASVVLPHLTAILPGEVQGSALGLTRTGYFMISASGPIVVGALADAGLFNEAFLMLSGIGLITLLLTARLSFSSN